MLCISAAHYSMSDPREKLALDTRSGAFEYLSSSNTTTPASSRGLNSPSPSMERNLLSPLSPSSSSSSPLFRNNRELPMPSVRSSCNLDQAKSTLQLCSNKLKFQFRQLIEAGPASTEALTILSEMRQYRTWLEQWEKAFSSHLSTAMPSMTQLEIKQCRVIKANHLSSMILASIAGVRDTDFEPFVSEFRAIVGLASAVLETETTPDMSPKSAVDMTNVVSTTAMTIADPLRIAVSCCSDHLVRNRASKLLHRVT